MNRFTRLAGFRNPKFGRSVCPFPQISQSTSHQPSRDRGAAGVTTSSRWTAWTRPSESPWCGFWLGCLIVCWLAFAPPATAYEEATASRPRMERLEILPAPVELVGSQDRQRIILHAWRGGTRREQVQTGVEWTIDDEAVCELRGDVLVPLGNGVTTLHASYADHHAQLEVTVRGVDQTRDASFVNDVLPVLAKLGCNSGACHGALAGKGGFRLSLRGYDPQADFFTMTRQARGRRIEMADPGRSLLIAKPSGAIPHEGGVRFEVDSPAYQILAEWIAQGAPAPRADEPELVDVQVHPDTSTLSPGETAQLIVTARFADGRTVDVTPWVKWTSANETVANVDEQGFVEVIGAGEGAITAWYSSRIAISRITSPFGQDIAQDAFEQAPQRNFIDKLSLAQLEKLNLPPSPRADDDEFIRRAYLDAIGVLPTATEVRSFLEDDSPEKRDRLIDSLLDRPEFVDYWTYHWSDLLLINGTKLRPAAVKSYYQWIRGHVERNTPWDEFVQELLVAQGDTLENGATNFYALHQEPETMSENASQAFLGLSIACAKCHNHPLEKWTNDQYYAMASLFARVRGKGWGGDSRNGDGRRTVYVVNQGELIQPRTGKPQPPTPLDGEPIPFDATEDRRLHLASWLTSPDNPYFARSITNRVWARFFGIGLVDPVDDMRVSNPASNEALLEAAADYLVAEDFDLKALMRVIMQSETYQRSSLSTPQNSADKRYFSHYFPKRLMAEVLLDAISQVTEVPSRFNKIEFLGADTAATDFYPEGTRAIQLYDSAVQSYFLKTFGRNQREITCECERSNEPSMVQVLHLANGNTLNQKLSSDGNRIDAWIAEGMSDGQIIDQLYLTALARYPTPSERQQLLATLQADAEDGRRILLEDLAWGVLSSREFLFNH